MSRLTTLFLILFLTTNCQKCASGGKEPAMLKSLPAGAQVLFQLDGRALLGAYSGLTENLKGHLPEKALQDVPPWDEVVAKLKQPTGIDLNQIGQVLAVMYFGPARPKPQVAVIIEGLTAKNLKGTQSGTHQGQPLYRLTEEEDFHYAQLDPGHLLACESQDFLKQVLDVQAGQGKSLLGTSPMLERLRSQDPAFDHIRGYLLTGDFPGLEKTPVKVEGGGFFMNLQKGFSAVIIGDPDGMGKLKLMAEMGILQAKNQMATASKHMPPAEAEKMAPMLKAAGEFIAGIQVGQDGEMLTVSYSGKQQPMFLIGMMAAIAIPAFVTYIKKSKIAEVYENLDRGYKGVLDYYDRPQALVDGSYQKSKLPPAMLEPLCPGNLKVETLDSQARQFDPDRVNASPVFKDTSTYLAGKSYACYMYTIDLAPKGDAPTGFTWHAWTDLDDDDRPAHWTKQGIYTEETRSFRAGHVWHDPESDDW